MPRSITAETFGAWVLKCNPREWDLARLIEDGETGIYGEWSVADNYRSQMMAPGDPVVFWVSGPDDAPLTPGVWGAGTVALPVEFALEVEEEDGLDPEGDLVDYWLSEESRRRARFFVDVNIPFSEPVSRAQLKADGRFDDLEMFHQPQGSNPAHLTAPEWAALKEMMGDGANVELDDRTIEQLKLEAAVAQPDPLSRLMLRSWPSLW